MAARDETAIYLTDLIVGRVVCSFLALLGTITNSINITVFKKQGFKDSMTISLFFISVVDLTRSILNVPLRLDWLLAVFGPPYVMESFQNVVFWVTFNLISPLGSLVAVMTAYVSLERCLAVCIPLKIKQVITPRVTSVVLIISTVVVMCSFSISVCAGNLELIFSSKYNETIVNLSQDQGLCNMDLRSVVILRFSISILWGMSTFVTIAACSVIIIARMRASTRFRSKSHAQNLSSTSKAPSLSTRDKQMMKVLLLINLIHLIGNGSPLFMPFIVHVFPGKRIVIRDIFTNVGVMFSLFNASANFFIYLRVSSNFKTTLKEWLNPSHKTTTNT